MSRLALIRAREEKAAERQGVQHRSWEERRREELREIEFHREWDSIPLFRRDSKYGYYY